MTNKLVLTWEWEDVQYANEDWSDEKCQEVFDVIYERLADRIIDAGNAELRDLLDTFGFGNDNN